MHETHLMNDLMEKILAVAREQGAEKVVGVRVQLGALSHFSPEHFREHFEQMAAGTIAEGARVTAQELTDIHHPQAQGVVLTSVEVE